MHSPDTDVFVVSVRRFVQLGDNTIFMTGSAAHNRHILLKPMLDALELRKLLQCQVSLLSLRCEVVVIHQKRGARLKSAPADACSSVALRDLPTDNFWRLVKIYCHGSMYDSIQAQPVLCCVSP